MAACKATRLCSCAPTSSRPAGASCNRFSTSGARCRRASFPTTGPEPGARKAPTTCCGKTAASGGRFEAQESPIAVVERRHYPANAPISSRRGLGLQWPVDSPVRSPLRVAALSIIWLLLCAATAPAAEGETETRSAAAGLASMKPRPGFSVELVAAEPLVMDPVAFAWGADGKLWVVEMADYPRGIDGQGKFGGRVRCLEDADGDGRYDKSTL